MGFLKVYTREPVAETYPNSLANSVHFAYSKDGQSYQPLNQGYGILFALADITEKNTIAERGIREPVISRHEDGYRITARRVDAAGEYVQEKPYIRWTTNDFITFSEEEEADGCPAEALCAHAAPPVSGVASGSDAGQNGASVGSVIEIPDRLWEGIKNRWLPLESVSVRMPEEPLLKSLDELDTLTAAVEYSDGSTDEKRIDWERESLTELGGGKYRIRGKLRRVDARFPLAVGYADPVIFSWDGAWYFLATNDNVGDIGLFVRKASSVDGLFEAGYEESCILEPDEKKGLVQTFWAPEFHVIGEELYILFAVSGTQWGPQCHMMRMKRGGEILDPAAWEEPIRVVLPDGRPLTEDGITLDMTYFKAGGQPYLAWSYRYAINSPYDTGSMIYIAKADEKKPWALASEPALLSRPRYGWENNAGTINNEGPYALILGNRVWLACSGGAACGYSYVVGYLTADADAELTDTENWTKTVTPAFSSASVAGIEGPGHNSFFRNEDGVLMIAYHAQEREKYHKRCSTYHRVHVSASGFPMLNVAGERDVADLIREVELEFRLKQHS